MSPCEFLPATGSVSGEHKDRGGNWDGRWGGSVYSSSKSSDNGLISDRVRGKGKSEREEAPANLSHVQQMSVRRPVSVSRRSRDEQSSRPEGLRTKRLWQNRQLSGPPTTATVGITRSSVQTLFIYLFIYLSFYYFIKSYRLFIYFYYVISHAQRGQPIRLLIKNSAGV